MGKYPLASNLLLSDFKLPRASVSKVSKMWIKNKMQAKIALCYGKDEAEKFKGSAYWF